MHQAVERSRKDDAAALLAGAQPEIDDVIGDADHVGIVLDDEHGVALIAKLAQDVDEPKVVARVQPDGGFVEHVERPDQRRAERGGQVDALRLAARERGRQPIEREVVEPDVAQERQAAPNLLQDLVGDRHLLVAQRERREELLRLLNGQRRHLIDRPAGDPHIARFAPEPRAAAVRAGQVAAIPAEKHAHVHLVFLPLEPSEETADALVAIRAVSAFDDKRLLLFGQLRPGHVEPDPRLLRRPLQLGQLRPVVRLAPRLDRVLGDRLRPIGHDEIHVELDDVAEAVAGRAGAERVVERKQARLRIFVRDAAFTALEALGEAMDLRAG